MTRPWQITCIGNAQCVLDRLSLSVAEQLSVVCLLVTPLRPWLLMLAWEMERTREAAVGGYDDSLQARGRCARSSLKHFLQRLLQLSAFQAAS